MGLRRFSTSRGLNGLASKSDESAVGTKPGKKIVFLSRCNVRKDTEEVVVTSRLSFSVTAVMAMIIAATVFVAGLESVGVLDAFLSMLKRRHSHAAWFAFFGNAGFAALSGSGDAASCSFNVGVTPLANELGERPRELGSMAWLGAEMGRCLSPVAVVTITVAALATTLVQANDPRALKIQATHVVFWTAAPILLAGVASVLLRRGIKA